MNPKSRSPLDPDRRTQEYWLEVLARFGLDHMEQLETASALGVLGAQGYELAEAVSVAIEEEPLTGGVERVVEILGEAVRATLSCAAPGYLAYIPGGGLYPAALADFVAGCMNRYTGMSSTAPGLCRLEADVIAWLIEAFDFGSRARGILTSGGSLANFTAVVTARERHLGGEGDLRQAMVYTSSQAHLSVRKSVRLAGIPARNVRAIAVDERLRMLPSALGEAIDADRGAGRQPFLVVSSAGTTNTGAVDPLSAIADVCRDRDVWHHVDGAYGGAFVLCDEGRRRLAGLERADSVTFDPHKGMFLPYGTGCLLVREGEHLRRAQSEDAEYLRDADITENAERIPSPADHGPELSRDFRGLRLWLCLMLFGARPFREALADKLALAQEFHDGLVRLQGSGLPLEVTDAPQLSVVAFRAARRPDESLDAWNERNRHFLAEINHRERVYISSTTLPGADGPVLTLRVCVLSFRTLADRIGHALEDVELTLRKLTG